jgi:multiple sugar transport system permease protein
MARNQTNKQKIVDKMTPYLLTFPGFLLIFVFTLFPFLLNVIVSFTDYSYIRPVTSFVFFKNYKDVILNGIFFDTVKKTLVWTCGNFIVIMILGLATSLLMTSKIKIVGILKACILLPWILPEVVTGYTFQWMFSGDYGIIWTYLVKLHIITSDYSFLQNMKGAMSIVILANIWRGFDFVAVMTYAKLKTIPDEYYEVAKLEGANALQMFIHVKFFWIYPMLQRSAFLIFVWTFNAFSIIYAITLGGPAGATEIISLEIQKLAFRFFDFGHATVMGTYSALIIIIVIGGAILLKKVFSPKKYQFKPNKNHLTASK